MTGHYTGKIEAGKIYNCKQCGKTPEVGQERFYQKKGENWIGCTDFDCFLKQGGDKDPATKGGGKFVSQKFPITEATAIYNLAEGMLDSFKKKRKLEHIKPEIEIVFIESLVRTLSSSFKP